MGKSSVKSNSKGASKKKAKSPKGSKSKSQKGSKAKSKSTKNNVVKEEPVVTVEPVVTEEPVVEPVVTEEPVVVETKVAKKPLTPRVTGADDVSKVPEIKLDDNITIQINALIGTIANLVTELKSVQSEVKSLQKNYGKVLKEHTKNSKKKNTNRQPSGFAKPSKISDEMAEFLSLDKSELVPRNEITKLINKYIIDNDLRNPSDKRQIVPNKELSTLLNLQGDEKLSYFNLQKYMKHHFIKT